MSHEYVCQHCKVEPIDKPEYCCSGYMCGCVGLPIDPPFCKECWENILGGSARKKRSEEQ